MNKNTYYIIIISILSLYSTILSTTLLIIVVSNTKGCLTKNDLSTPNSVIINSENIMGLISSEQIRDVETNKLSGFINDSMITGLSSGKLIGAISDDNIISLSAGKLLGLVNNDQIASIDGFKLQGLITDDKISNLSVSKLSGQLTDDQIMNVSIDKINGQILDSKVDSISSSKITGMITDSQISSLYYNKLLGGLSVKAKKCETRLSGSNAFESLNCDLSITDHGDLGLNELWVIFSNFEITNGGSLNRIQIAVSESNTTFIGDSRKDYVPSTLLDVSSNSNGNLVGSMTPFLYVTSGLSKPYLVALAPSTLTVNVRMNFIMIKMSYNYN